MTAAGRWQLFGTATFRPQPDVWRAGFPWSKNTNPHFAHRLFNQLVIFIESQLQTTMNFICADQLGFLGGKFHQHFLLSAAGLDRYPIANISNWMFQRSGFNRVVPARYGAERYVGRFIALR